jgi:signal transduction histidine kinase
MLGATPKQAMLDLLRLATQQDQISGLHRVLQTIAERTESFGCIIWQAAPDAALDPPHGDLFVLAEWFPGPARCAVHDLSVARSQTGKAMAAGTQAKVLVTDLSPEARDRFLTEKKIYTFCTTPLLLDGGKPGALNLYRQATREYEDNVLDLAREYAELIPLLYDVILNKIRANLFIEVDQILQSIDTTESGPPGPQQSAVEQAAQAIPEVCRKIQRAFNCREVSIFLEHGDTPGLYKLEGTTWKGGLWRRTSYHAAIDDGITGWSLTNPDTPVLIFDLGTYDQDAINQVYSGMNWLDSLDICNAVRTEMKIGEADPLPPIPLMTAPIVRGPDVFGVIRCCVGGDNGPFYFSMVCHEILQMVAAQLGPFWGARRDLDDVDQVVSKLRELNTNAYKAISGKNSEERIMSQVLDVAAKLIRGAEINDVRLVTNDEPRYLYFAATKGKAWKSGTPKEIQTRRERLYPLHGKSSGAQVMSDGRAYVRDDVTKDPNYSKNFDDVKRMIIAPVMLSEEKFGVLDLRTTIDRPFPRHAVLTATLLGTQLAMYLQFTRAMADRRRLLEVAQGTAEVQVRLNQDMAHQFHSPILIAHGRVQDALSNLRALTADQIEAELRTVRGVCARAMHVSSNSRMFAELARNQKITTTISTMSGADLVSMLINTGKDTASLYDNFDELPPQPTRSGYGVPRHITDASRRIWVTPDGLEELFNITTDRRLLEQAVTQILDNAFKYSFPHTTVRVSGGLTRSSHSKTKRPNATSGSASGNGNSRRLRITIASEGIRLDRTEVSKCRNRGWQSETAAQFKQGGAGIGLWIVDNIMSALNGDMHIRPTDNDEITEFTLVVPIQ